MTPKTILGFARVLNTNFAPPELRGHQSGIGKEYLTVVRFLYSVLRGNIPGGPWILLILLGMFTFILWYIVRTSGLLEPERARRILFRGWALLIAGYAVIWLVTRPEPPPKTLLIPAFADYTTEGWIGEALAYDLGNRFAATSAKVIWLPWEAAPSLRCQQPPDSLYQTIKDIEPTYAVWAKVWGRQDSLWVESHYAKTKWGRTVRFPLHKRRFNSYRQAADRLWELALKSLNIPQRSDADYTPDSHPMEALQYLHTSRQQLRDGNTEHALELAVEALKTDSTWDRAWAMVGICWDHMDDTLARGIFALRKAVLLDSSDVRNWLSLARYSIRRRQWDRAESSLKIAYLLEMHNPTTLYLMSHLSKDRLERFSTLSAQQCLERALKIYSGYRDVRLRLAQMIYQTGNMPKCEQLLLNGLEIDPNSWELRKLLAIAQVRLGKLQEALTENRKLLETLGDDPGLLYNMGLVYFHMDSLDQAQKHLTKSVALRSNSDAYYLLGQCAERNGDSTTATQFYRHCAAASTGDDNRSAEQARKKLQEATAP